jgi:SUMO ligase MMS21 Smc5/6 complex component
MLEPHYQIFKNKLKKVKFKDMKTHFPTVDNFVEKINIDFKKNGLLCPIVLDADGLHIRSGAHRHAYFKDKYDSTLCYVGENGEETKFFQYLNVFCWNNHPIKNPEFLNLMYDKAVEHVRK